MDVPRALEKLAAFAVGIVNGFDRALDPVDRMLCQREHEAVVPGFQSVEDVERLVDARRPSAGLPIFDIAARRRRLVDRLIEARRQRLVVGAVDGRGDLQLAKQGRVALRKVDDHRDENSVRLIREVGADARERAGAFRFEARIDLIRGERGRHHVLAETIIVEGGTVAFAFDRLALAEEIDAIVLRSRDLRQHAPGFDGEDLDASFPMVGLAADEGASGEAL